jgi:SH3 domain protein
MTRIAARRVATCARASASVSPAIVRGETRWISLPRRLIALVLGLTCAGSNCLAQIIYVTDQIQIGLHSGADGQHPVTQLVSSGTALETLQRNGNFIKVRTGSGAEGWVDQAYVRDTPPSIVVRREMESIREAQAAELQALREEIERLKSDLLDTEENRQRQIKALSRKASSDAQALRQELDALRVVRAATPVGDTPEAANHALHIEIQRLSEELRRAQAPQESVVNGRIPSDTLREMERLARDAREAKVRLAGAQTEARRLASAAHSDSPLAQSQLNSTNTAHAFGPWHWALLGSAALLIFGLGNLWADFMVRRRHGGFRL